MTCSSTLTVLSNMASRTWDSCSCREHTRRKDGLYVYEEKKLTVSISGGDYMGEVLTSDYPPHPSRNLRVWNKCLPVAIQLCMSTYTAQLPSSLRQYCFWKKKKKQPTTFYNLRGNRHLDDGAHSPSHTTRVSLPWRHVYSHHGSTISRVMWWRHLPTGVDLTGSSNLTGWDASEVISWSSTAALPSQAHHLIWVCFFITKKCLINSFQLINFHD